MYNCAVIEHLKHKAHVCMENISKKVMKNGDFLHRRGAAVWDLPNMHQSEEKQISLL